MSTSGLFIYLMIFPIYVSLRFIFFVLLCIDGNNSELQTEYMDNLKTLRELSCSVTAMLRFLHQKEFLSLSLLS